MPLDMIFNRRIISLLQQWNLFNSANYFLELFLNLQTNHTKYGLRPKHRALSTHPTTSEALPSCIASGLVTLKQNVQKFYKNGVIFEGEEKVTEVDEVILATGYEITFPFLSEDIFKVKRNLSDLYKRVFPAHLNHPSLAFIGLIQPLGCIFPIAEAQSRWFAQLMRRNCYLPPTTQMIEEVKRRHDNMTKRFVDSPRHTIQVDWVPYMDEINAEFGAKPKFWKLALKDLRLFYACFTGAAVAYQYRLEGPHTWEGARDAILSVQERVEYPFKTYTYTN